MSLITPTKAAARPPAVQAVWGAIGNGITAGWGSTDPATKGYASAVPHIGRPGQTLTHPNSWNQAFVDTFAGDVKVLKDQGVNAIVAEIGLHEVEYTDDADSVWQDAYNRALEIGENKNVYIALSMITPFGAGTLQTQLAQDKRVRMNNWISSRTTCLYAGYVLGGDVLKPEYDSGDHTHPSDAGHAAMATCLSNFMDNHVRVRLP